MKNKLIFKVAVFSLFIYILTFASCGGGGGGGASLPDSQYSTHNPRGWGGNGGSGGGSSGENGGSGGNNTISGGTPLTVTGYTYNGQTYPTVEALRDAIATDAFPYGTTSVDFTCTTGGGSTETRTARITKTADGNNTNISIEHQYKAVFPADGGGTQEVLFYKGDGIVLPGDPAGTEDNGFIFETNWNIGGSLYACGQRIGVSSSGDLDFSTATKEIAPYGFKEESGEYVLGFSSSASGDIAVHTNKVIKQVNLNSGSPINLDFTGVTFKNNVIDSSYFTGTASNLTGITLPYGLTAIGNDTFVSGYNSLQTVVIPNSVTSIGERAFKTCTALENISLGTGVQTIGESAFYGCSSLETFAMPNSVESIGGYAFYNCSSLETLTLSNSLHSIPYFAFYNCGCIGPDLEIPGSITNIGTSAFWHCTGIQNLTLNSGLQTIDSNAFEGCTGLTEVAIPDTVSVINDGVFISCTSLDTISLPTSVDTIGNYVFRDAKAGCVLTINSDGSQISLGTMALPNSNFKVRLTGTGIPMKDVSNTIFDSNTNLTEVTITGSLASITDYAFYGCTNLKDFIIDSSVTTIATIGQDAFCNCVKLETINIPASVSRIKTEAFKNAGRDATNNCTITFDGNQTFSECYLPTTNYKVQLNSNVPKVSSGGGGESIFNSEDTLQSVIFYGCTDLNEGDFSLCNALGTVTFNSYPSNVIGTTGVLPTTVHTIIFESNPQEMTIRNTVQNLFTPTYAYASLTVQFMNDPNYYTGITINAGAFNFSGAENIRYTFNAPPTANMHYENGTCFTTGKTTSFNSTTFTWNGSGSWQ